MDIQDHINQLPRDRANRIGVVLETQDNKFRHWHVRYPSGRRRKLNQAYEIGHGLIKELSSNPWKTAVLWSKYYPWIDLMDARKAVNNPYLGRVKVDKQLNRKE